jgi:6-phosphogluconolactonase
MKSVLRALFIALIIHISLVLPLLQAQSRHRHEFALVTNQASDTISVRTIKPNGTLGNAISPLPAGGSPNSIAVVPSGRFIYVADVIPGGISAFSVEPSGVLTPLTGFPVVTPDGTVSVTTDPSGRFLYALNCGANCSSSGSGFVSAYSINQQTGALSPIPGSASLTGEFPYSLAVDPTGHFAYVANAGSGDVYSYSINSDTGALTQIGSPVAAGTRPISIVVDPWSQFVYTANTGSSNVSAFAINFDGTLTKVAGSPFATGTFTANVAATGDGKFILITAVSGVFVFKINNDGTLHSVPGSPFPAGTGPSGISIDPTGSFVYVANRGSGDISVYRFNKGSGKLTARGSVAAPGAPAIIAVPAPLHQ